MPRQLWVADACRAAGLEVQEVDGWRTRGSETFNPRGVVAHHTAGASTGEIPSLRTLIHGRSDLPGPLCQLGLARSGAVYVVAAGRANHAGSGGWKGLTGNSSVFGIEAENDGRQAWPTNQYAAYKRLCAVLCRGAEISPDMVCGHKEWAPGRKPDPHTIDMARFRSEVRALMHPEPVPPVQEGEMAFRAYGNDGRQYLIWFEPRTGAPRKAYVGSADAAHVLEAEGVKEKAFDKALVDRIPNA